MRLCVKIVLGGDSQALDSALTPVEVITVGLIPT